MLADTSSAPAAMTDDVGATAAALAALSVEPTLAKSVAAATISGTAMRNDIGALPPNPRQRVSPLSRQNPHFRVTYLRRVREPRNVSALSPANSRKVF
jgi:hypothetical protein